MESEICKLALSGLFTKPSTLDHLTLCIIFKAEPVISDLALRGVGSYPYEPEAQRTRFSMLEKNL